MNSPQTISQIVKAREAEEFTDFVLVCNGQRIPVHRIIVCSQSPVLRAACTGPYKEASGEYFMDDHPLSMVRRMVDYLYTGNYAEEITETGIEDQAGVISPLRVHAMMFAMGDKYLMEGLQCLSVANYANALSRNPNICNFIRSLPDVYALTPDSSRGLRNKALEFARENLPASLASTEPKDTYDNIASDVPEFIKDLLDSFLQEPLVGAVWAVDVASWYLWRQNNANARRAGRAVRFLSRIRDGRVGDYTVYNLSTHYISKPLTPKGGVMFP